MDIRDTPQGTDHRFDRLIELLERTTDHPSSVELDELNSILTEESALHFAAQLLIDESLLREDMAVDAASELLSEVTASLGDAKMPVELPIPAVVAPSRVSETPRRHRLHDWGILLAALLIGVVGTLCYQAMTGDHSQANAARSPVRSFDDERVAAPTSRGPVPRLVASTGCVWNNSDSRAPSVGQEFEGGEVLQLIEGIAAVELRGPDASRGRVRIAGPAGVFVRSDGFLGLQHGILLADTRQQFGGFAVDTPAGRISVSALSSVGIIAENGSVEVHVFQGRATIDSAVSTLDGVAVRGPTGGASRSNGSRRQGEMTSEGFGVVAAGEAAKILQPASSEPTIEQGIASYARFGAMRSMAYDQLELGPEYANAVIASKPVVYWRFENDGELIENQGSRPGIDCRLIGGKSWRSNESNSSLEFGLTEQAGFMEGSDPWPVVPLADYSVELWAKPSHFQQSVLLCLTGPQLDDGRYPHSLILELGGPYNVTQLSPPGTVRFLHRVPVSGDYYDGSSCASDAKYTVRKWQHIVARKSRENLELLIDGQLVASATDDNHLPAGTRIVVGQLYPDAALRPFVGQLDEIALYERALTDAEILEHIKQARIGEPVRDSI